MSDTQDPDVPELWIDDPEPAIIELLRSLQHAALAHPEASAALFSAFVAEGRAYAQTSEGARLKSAILGSVLLERALLVWEAASLFIPQHTGPLPSSVLDAISNAASSDRRDAILQRLLTTLEDA